ncbi:hypothetical protein [Hydrogenophaga intermedia]|uniref:Uncharacterized protein n=1 Tax=Hydrogenophaga intermedia TaxID=65786 RepID=A0A1L1PDE8_HYDIT|nr:hypothetical protein [Hydrogenophaga intermedia]TMU77926.1 hypothetical protein FGJ01_00830 [Hydrogenophaga intermedia]CDN85779.1 hypothetical protein BN948_00172 [Hydrogenophaga intermedia]
MLTTIITAILAGTLAGLAAAWLVVKLNKPFATGGYAPAGAPYAVGSQPIVDYFSAPWETPDYWLTVTGDPATERAFDTAAECADYKERYDRDGSWTVQPAYRSKPATLGQLAERLAVAEEALGEDALVANLHPAVLGGKLAQEGGAA